MFFKNFGKRNTGLINFLLGKLSSLNNKTSDSLKKQEMHT